MLNKIKNQLITYTCFIIFTQIIHQNAFSQKNNSNYFFKAKILDTISKEPIQYASIFFISKLDTISTLSNKNGDIKVSLKPQINYLILIRAISYLNTIDTSFQYSNLNHKIKDTFLLKRNKDILSNVLISSNSINERLGSTVYNVSENDIKTSSNVAEVLSRAPYLTVNNEGKIRINNKQCVQILINGKPIFDEHILVAMPPDLVKKIEIITNPSAIYDKNKLGGIINIISNKNWTGLFGNTMFTIGNNQTLNASNSLCLNFKKIKFNYFLGINNYKRPFNSEIFREDLINGKIYKQLKVGDNHGISPYGKIGFEYTFDSSNEFTYLLHLNQSKFDKSNSTIYSSNITTTNLQQDFVLTAQDKREFSNIKNYFDFTHLFKINKSKLTISAWNSLSRSEYNSNSLYNYLNSNTIFINANKEIFEENILQIEYTLPRGKQCDFTVGAKFIDRKNSAAYTLDSFDFGTNNFIRVKDLEKSNNYKNHQSIYEIYNNLTFIILKKINTEIGFRIEHSNTNSNFGLTENFINNRYVNILPSFNLLYKKNDSNNFKAGLSKSIQRPSLDYLNPYINFLDPRNLQSGNPYLLPEVYNHIEASYSYTKENLLLNVLSYFDFNNKIINELTSIYNIDTLITKYENCGKSNTFGISFYTEKKLFNAIKASSDITIEKNTITSTPLKNNGYYFLSNINLSYNLPHNILFRLGMQYATKQISLQGKDASISSVDFAIRKKILHNRMSVTIYASDFLKINSTRNYFLKTNTFTQTVNSNLHLATINMKIAFDFGKINFRKYSESKINNSDLKKKG